MIPQTLTYATRGSVDLAADVYRAEQAGGPLCIAIHGGGWRSGSAKRYREWGPYLAERGITVMSIDYRLTDPSSKDCFPAQIRDVNAAVDYAIAHAGDLGIDPGRIALMGDSAGAHLSALCALAPHVPEFFDEGRARGDAKIRAVVGVYGVYDLLAQFEYDLSDRTDMQIITWLMGVSAFDDPHAYFKASPLSYVTRRKEKPAFLLSWGMEDDLVDYQTQSLRFLTALKRLGFVTRSHPVVGAPHLWIKDPIDDPTGHTAALAPRVVRFLNEQTA